MIGITIGDPSGIGPEIVSRAVRDDPAPDEIVIFGDRGVLDRAGGVPDRARLVEVTAIEAVPGEPSIEGARAQVAYLEAAVEAARRGEIQALVTAPISKQQAKRAGFAFPGHTEFLAERLGAPGGPPGQPAEHAMMFVGPRLRVALATIHLPIAEVARALTSADVARAAALGAQALARHLGIARPRVGVVGLNPHAGEHGLFGDEEDRVIRPGIAAAAERVPFATFQGPLVPDAAFRAALDGNFDLLVAMYHDQGLIPVKLVDFEQAVNVTVGLPIVRTSPDHGVAYDIAGRGVARHRSFAAALSLARLMNGGA